MLELITDPDDPRLFIKARTVTDIEAIRHYIPEMISICKREEALGLSANQVGLPYAIFVTVLPRDWPRIYINPTLKPFGKLITVQEGCLSNPGTLVTRKRFANAILLAENLKDEQVRMVSNQGYYQHLKIGQLAANVWQHEYEHLKGIDTRTGERPQK